MSKSSSLFVRVEPGVKEALAAAAAADGRSLSSLVAKIVAEWTRNQPNQFKHLKGA